MISNMFTNLVVTGFISLYPVGLDDFEQADEYVEMYDELDEAEDDLTAAEDALNNALSEIDRLEGELDAVKDELSEANAELDELKGAETSDIGAEEPIEQLSETEDMASSALLFEATYYTARCDGCSGITATGYDVRSTIYSPEGYRIIAVDPNVIPLGSVVRVTYGDETSFKAIASDTGGDIKGRRIDVLVTSKEEAYRLGRTNVSVETLAEGD